MNLRAFGRFLRSISDGMTTVKKLEIDFGCQFSNPPTFYFSRTMPQLSNVHPYDSGPLLFRHGKALSSLLGRG